MRVRWYLLPYFNYLLLRRRLQYSRRSTLFKEGTKRWVLFLSLWISGSSLAPVLHTTCYTTRAHLRLQIPTALPRSLLPRILTVPTARDVPTAPSLLSDPPFYPTSATYLRLLRLDPVASYHRVLYPNIPRSKHPSSALGYTPRPQSTTFNFGHWGRDVLYILAL